MENEISYLEHAKMYIDSLANGIDPVLNLPANADTLRNEQVIACFEYISDVLERYICNIEYGMNKNNDFFITEEQIDKLNISPYNLKISEIADEINRVTQVNKTKKLPAVSINNWLEAEGYLCKSDLNGRISTEKGNQLGITTERRKAKDGNEYYINLYSTQAQKFIFEHLNEIITLRNERSNQTEEIIENIDFPYDLSIEEFIQQQHDKCFILSVGSCDTLAKRGSYTAVLLFKGKSKVLKKSAIPTNSSNKCILTGILEAVSAIKMPTDIVILTSNTLGFNMPKSKNYSIWQEIFRMLEEKKCTFSISVCQGRGTELYNFIQSFE